ncbi:hypothetical protein PG996_008873 [Apiospora saccharicola]|uniref:DUF7918 domain-containing protein n=1 Tax=Apiospora saccharicola TaxID=335842 RepID=A0ABR1V1Q4_9PEZI
MAILAEVPGIQVVVKVEGRVAAEFPDPEPQHRRALDPVSCVYIESVDDARFVVEVVVYRSYDFTRDEKHSLWVHVEVDGERCGMAGCEITKEQVTASPGGRRERLDSARERRGSHIFLQKFRFATIKKGTAAMMHLYLLPVLSSTR